MPMRWSNLARSRKRRSFQAHSMTRRILFVVGAALLSAAGFAAILGVGWLVSHFVLGVVPYILASRLHAMREILPALFLLVAFIGGAWAACTMAPRTKDERQKNGHPAH
ncbi:MAG TPA: hypothetical protein VKR52_20905 [Terracidiphilus sp.]|nr:hypothetical protein [Terracidiphilus sp.]